METDLVLDKTIAKIASIGMKDKANYIQQSPYSIGEGDKIHFIPRVTELLGTIHEDYIASWANSLGFKHMSYKKTLQAYADEGTEVHEEIHEFFMSGELGLTTGFQSFLKWWDGVRQCNPSNILSETTLMCQYFGGTADLIFTIGNETYLVDFKTSKNIGYKYMLQLAAYAYMINTTTPMHITKCIILQVDKTTPKFNEYLFDLNQPHMQAVFCEALNYMVSLSYGYLQNLYLREQFQIFSKARNK